MSTCHVTAKFMSHLLSKEQGNMSTYDRIFKRIKGDRELHLMMIAGDMRLANRYDPETTQKSCQGMT